MATPKELYYEKRGQVLVKNLKSRHFDAYYCANKEEALEKALELIPEGSAFYRPISINDLKTNTYRE